ncbi:MAG TPA: SRPBCC family protein, partial [Vicinamibacteria bacterium]
MWHLESVTPEPNGRSRWVAKLTGAPTLSWEAELVEDRPGEHLSWRSLPGSDVDNAGTVRFVELPAGRGTGVRVDLLYRPLAGPLGQPFARLLTPLVRQQIHEDVRRFKSVIEAHEVPTTEGQPRGEAQS